MRISPSNLPSHERLAACFESHLPSYIYVSEVDSHRPGMSSIREYQSHGLVAFLRNDFCIIDASELSPDLIRNGGEALFPHYDAYWFLNDLASLKSAPQFVPWTGATDSPPVGVSSWSEVETWMLQNGLFLGVLWTDLGPYQTLEVDIT